MTDVRVIKASQLPARLPIFSTIVVWLLMDRLQAGQLAWGIVGTFMAILWVVCITLCCIQKSTPVRYDE